MKIKQNELISLKLYSTQICVRRLQINLTPTLKKKMSQSLGGMFTNKASNRVMGLKCLQKFALKQLESSVKTTRSEEIIVRCILLFLSNIFSSDREERKIAGVKILTTGDFSKELKRNTRGERGTCSVVY